jgi:Na+-transporting methylmalonyl-CoA/oxaloacetate decarboxylase gamma subunit
MEVYMLGVTIGVILLILLVGLVVLQGAIEWGGFDPEKIMNKNKKEEKSPKKENVILEKTKKIKRKGKK